MEKTKLLKTLQEIVEFAYEIGSSTENKETTDATDDIIAYVANIYAEETGEIKCRQKSWVRTNKPFGITIYRCNICGWYEMRLTDNIRYKCPMCGEALEDKVLEDMERV